MKGNPAVLAELQKLIPMELSLSAQYHLDAINLKEALGLKKFACRFSEFGEDCEDYVKILSKRLLFFDTKPEYATDGPVTTADALTGMFQAAFDAEVEIVTAYNAAIPMCVEAKDDNTRNMLEHLVKWHEESHAGKQGGAHVDWLQKKLAQIALYGETEFRLEYI